MLKRIGLGAATGLALALAFEPVAWAWLLPLGVTGYLLALRGTRGRRAFVVGLAFGVPFYFTHIEWMRAVGTDAWIGLAGVESLMYAALAPITARLMRLPGWPVWCALAWTAMEYVRSGWPFSGMPWGRLSYGVVDTPAAPALAYVGATGVSFLLALLGASLAAVVVRRRPVGAAGAVVALAVLALAAVFPWRAAPTGHTRIAVVQGNVPGDGSDILLDHRQVTRNHRDVTVELARRVAAGEVPAPDFVLWPENSTAVDPFADPEIRSDIETATHAIGVPVVVGGVADGDPTHVLNQGIVWDPVTGPGERYTKHHPVPYGEYIPFRELLDGRNFGKLAIISRDMVSGTNTHPIEVAGVPVADAICFDIVYDDVLQDQIRHGAELVTVQTSNAIFIHTHQIEQQFAITRLRAIETGRYVAVASPNGVSGVIGPDGSVVARAGVRTQEALLERVGLIREVTPAMHLGTWPGRVAVALTLLLWVAALRRVGAAGETGARAVGASCEQGPDRHPVREETLR